MTESRLRLIKDGKIVAHIIIKDGKVLYQRGDDPKLLTWIVGIPFDLLNKGIRITEGEWWFTGDILEHKNGDPRDKGMLIYEGTLYRFGILKELSNYFEDLSIGTIDNYRRVGNIYEGK